MFAYANGYILPLRSCFRIYQQLISSRADQEAPVSSGVLDRHTHDPFDELFEHNLAGKCLRDLDHGSDIEPFDGHFNRAGWTRRAAVRPQPRMELIQLPHLSVGTPTQIAGSGLPQLSVCNCLQRAACVEARRKLVGYRLVGEKSVCACRHDGALVQLRGIEWSTLDARNLRADQRSTILKILRAIRGQGA